MRREEVQKCSISYMAFTFPLEEYFMSGIEKTIDIESFNFFKNMLRVKHVVGLKKIKTELRLRCYITYERTGKFSDDTKNSFKMSVTPLTKFDNKTMEMLTAVGRRVLAIAPPLSQSPLLPSPHEAHQYIVGMAAPVTSPTDSAMSESSAVSDNDEEEGNRHHAPAPAPRRIDVDANAGEVNVECNEDNQDHNSFGSRTPVGAFVLQSHRRLQFTSKHMVPGIQAAVIKHLHEKHHRDWRNIAADALSRSISTITRFSTSALITPLKGQALTRLKSRGGLSPLAFVDTEMVQKIKSDYLHPKATKQDKRRCLKYFLGSLSLAEVNAYVFGGQGEKISNKKWGSIIREQLSGVFTLEDWGAAT
jgi:hypothetical protein